MDSTLNSMSNPRFDQTQNLNKPNTKETSKSYYMMSSFQKTSKKLYSQRDKELLINQQYYDPEVLKKQLNNCKTKIHEQKSTFLNLKIRYGKLYNENMNNKNLISNILGTPLDKYVTKEEVLDKIENAKLTESKKAKLQEALDSIILRLNIEEKKEINNKLEKEYKELKENSKVKKINEIANYFFEKCDEQRKLLRVLKKLGEKCGLYENEVQRLEEIYTEEKSKKNEQKKKREELEENYDKLSDERINLIKQNKLIEEKIKKNIMLNREKNEKNFQKEKSIQELDDELNEINKYKNMRNKELNTLNEKKKLDESYKKNKSEQEKELIKLNKECDELNEKMSDYNEEKPKL